MFDSLISLILALLGLGFLIFIHELGHYIAARRVGMRVEAFSIGFGKPIYSWKKDGVKWQISWLPFGGFVKIAGMEKERGLEPHQIKDGFFGKSPFSRILVAFAGPFVNILFALLMFFLLFSMGGRTKSFSEFSSVVGWVDQNSELYQKGLRPGDRIISYDDHSYATSKDHLYAPMLGGEIVTVEGENIDPVTGVKKPFSYEITPYSHPESLDSGIKSLGVLAPFNYIIYDRIEGQENPLPAGSPLIGSGIEYGDQIFWVDGERVFSSRQLKSLLNDERALLTVERAGKTHLVRVPRVFVSELNLPIEVKEELRDWQYASGIQKKNIKNLYVIPYNLSSDCRVESRLNFIDQEDQEKAFPETLFSMTEAPLKEGDRIIAVDGNQVEKSYQLLQSLQERQVHIIVRRDPGALLPISHKAAIKDTLSIDQPKDLLAITSSIGQKAVVQRQGPFYLLQPILPKARVDFLQEKQASLMAQELEKQKKVLEEMPDSIQKEKALAFLEAHSKEKVIGIQGVLDRKVVYNPSAFALFNSVVAEIQRTLSALLVGDLSPKWVSGPVGILQVMQSRFSVGIEEIFYWLGAISLNLAILNLLPIPFLDGGHIMISLFEMVTKKRLSAKAMERLVIPFAVLLIGFFIFVTFYDLTRLFSSLF